MTTDNSHGFIHLIIGPMFSGKTSMLIRLIERYDIAKKKVLMIKYEKDTRYSNQCRVITHNQLTYQACTVVTLNNVLLWNNYDVIGIDEGQFFSDVVKYVEGWANSGKIVIVAGLDATFERKPFTNMIQLIPKAETVTKLTAVCMDCFSEASFTKRISDEKEVQVIGGEDKYKAVCRKCYFKLEIIKK